MSETRETADSSRSKRKNAGVRAVRLASLTDAFDKYSTPPPNRALIQNIYDQSDIEQIVGFGDYFQLKRRGGYPALEVHPGYTNGFRTEQDVLRRVGEDVPRWPSRRFHGAWGIDHPVDGAPARASRASGPKAPRAPKAPKRVPGSSAPAAPGTGRTAAPEKPKPVCMTCFLELPATGVCSNCGE
ncbi:hypothetical protein [Microbacterium halophytorum]|uniref:hypothetical protein n=1 Tax=Microbacterium halophytorum TaxID=2067568 RepID=UPI00131A1EA9|nr:hypothetical protein [Microbacterium halophytorum]